MVRLKTAENVDHQHVNCGSQTKLRWVESDNEGKSSIQKHTRRRAKIACLDVDKTEKVVSL